MKAILAFQVEKIGRTLDTGVVTLPMSKASLKTLAVDRTTEADSRFTYTTADIRFASVTVVED